MVNFKSSQGGQFSIVIDNHGDDRLQDRLLAASYALPVQELLQDLADEIDGWWADGVPEDEIDRRATEWLRSEIGDGSAELEQQWGWVKMLFPSVDLKSAYKQFGVEQWMIDCAKSIARTSEPLPFYPLAAGFYFVVPDDEFPMMVTVTTPFSDPELVARKLVKEHKKLFGTKAAKSTNTGEVEAARMLAMHRQGMSYREIAIQELRADYPDIIHTPHRYRKEISSKRSTIAKRIAALQKVWKERGV